MSANYLDKYLSYVPSDQKQPITFHFEAIGAMTAEIGSDVCTDGTGQARATMGPTNPVYITVSREVRDTKKEWNPNAKTGANSAPRYEDVTDQKNIDSRKDSPLYPWVEKINSGSLKKRNVQVSQQYESKKVNKKSAYTKVVIFTMKNAFPIRATKSTDQRGVVSEEITFLAEGFEAGKVS